MRNAWIWPGIVAGLLIAFEIYNRFYPCRDGLFIGACGSARAMLYIAAAVDLILYAVASEIYRFICKRKGKKASTAVFISIGIASVLVMYVGIRYGYLAAAIFWIFAHLLDLHWLVPLLTAVRLL